MKKAGEEGQAIIEQKLAHIRTYMRQNWNIDLEELRAVVQRRAVEYKKLDFEHLK